MSQHYAVECLEKHIIAGEITNEGNFNLITKTFRSLQRYVILNGPAAISQYHLYVYNCVNVQHVKIGLSHVYTNPLHLFYVILSTKRLSQKMLEQNK